MAKNKENKQFTITLSERQLRLLAYACRVTDRLFIGQLDYSLQECCEGAFLKLHKNDGAGKVGSNEWYTMRYVVKKSMDILRKLCWGVAIYWRCGLLDANTRYSERSQQTK